MSYSTCIIEELYMFIQNANFCLYVKKVKSTLLSLWIKTLHRRESQQHFQLFSLTFGNHQVKQTSSYLNFLIDGEHSGNLRMSKDVRVIWMKFL